MCFRNTEVKNCVCINTNTYSVNDSGLVKAKMFNIFVCDIHADEQPLGLSPHHPT